MAEKNSRHRLTTILYADVASYSRLMGQDELGSHRRVMEVLDFASASIKQGEGQDLRYAGDAILAEFSSVVNAVNTALAISAELDQKNRPLPQQDQVQIRIGINLG